MKNHHAPIVRIRKPSALPDTLLDRICIIFNTAYPESDEYLGKALAEQPEGMTLDEFNSLARKVAREALRDRWSAEADFVHAVQQRATRIKFAAEDITPPESH
jgi:hypothetical protein